MSADITAAAAASAAALAASEFLRSSFGVPLDAVGCGLAGAYIGLHFVKEPISTGRALRLFLGFGLAAAIVGNWASKDATTRELVSLFAGMVGTPAVRLLVERAGELLTILFDRLKGRP